MIIMSEHFVRAFLYGYNPHCSGLWEHSTTLCVEYATFLCLFGLVATIRGVGKGRGLTSTMVLCWGINTVWIVWAVSGQWTSWRQYQHWAIEWTLLVHASL